MNSETVLELYPNPTAVHALAGLYLTHGLPDRARSSGPLVYANFVSSLDGRIALIDSSGHSRTPECLTTGNDWFLFRELYAQADCIVVHGAYMRMLASGDLGNILQLGSDPASRYLHQWRAAHGLAPQPDIVIASSSLDFPLPPSVDVYRQTVRIATAAGCDREKARAWECAGYEVLLAGRDRMVEGGALVEQLHCRGYASIYLLGGPRLLETTVRDRVLSRLYLTISHRLIGGAAFHTMLSGNALGLEGRLKLQSLYLDPAPKTGDAQFYACFEPLETALSAS